jgi:uncharacterized protein YuzE
VKITYDSDVDALTVVLSREPVERTVDVGEGRYLDFNEDGAIIAIEVLDVSQGFRLDDLVGQYDFLPVVSALNDYLKTARELLHSDELKDVLAV